MSFFIMIFLYEVYMNMRHNARIGGYQNISVFDRFRLAN